MSRSSHTQSVRTNEPSPGASQAPALSESPQAVDRATTLLEGHSISGQSSIQRLVGVLEGFVAPRPTSSVEQVTQAAQTLRELLERFPSTSFRDYNGSINHMMLSNALDLIALSDGMPGREALIRRTLTGSSTGKATLDPFIAAGLSEFEKLVTSSVATNVASHDGLCDRIQSALKTLKEDTLSRHTGRGDVIKVRLSAAGDLGELQESFCKIDADLQRLIELIPPRQGGGRSPRAVSIARHCAKYPLEVEHCHLGEAARCLDSLRDAVESARKEILRSTRATS